MAGRLFPGIRKPIDFAKIKFGDRAAQRRRRTALAFAAGAVLFVASAAAMISSGANAQEWGRGLFATIFAPAGASFESVSPYGWGRPVYAQSGYRDLAPGRSDGIGQSNKSSKTHRSHLASFAASSSRRLLCVRLCDGFFFPVSRAARTSHAASDEAACSQLCPDAPTELFYQPTGSDLIEDAVSATGQRYTDLPVALRYRSTFDDTCSCHRSPATALNPLKDPTLVRGDALMTPEGIVVFRGAEQATHTSRDFAALAAARLPKGRRATLRALEIASRAPQRGATRSWATAETAAPVSSEPATETATSEIVDKIRFVERPD